MAAPTGLWITNALLITGFSGLLLCLAVGLSFSLWLSSIFGRWRRILSRLSLHLLALQNRPQLYILGCIGVNMAFEMHPEDDAASWGLLDLVVLQNGPSAPEQVMGFGDMQV